MNIPLVSIITVNYNGLSFLRGLLESLATVIYSNLEIIVVDNASTDGSVAFVKENFPQVRIVENPQNYFFARGNNIGIRQARGKYICLINNDVKVDPYFIEPIIKLFEENPALGACQPKILNMEKPEEFEYAGAAGGYLDILGYPFLRGRIFDSLETDEGQYNDTVNIFWASGACLFLRAEALNQVGLLDESFQMHMEEIDLSWRLQLNGWQVWYCPNSRIWHHGGGTLPQNNPRKVYWNFRNNIFLLVKNLSTLNLILRLPGRVVVDMVAALNEFVRLHFLNSVAILKAYGWLILHPGLLWKRRRESQTGRKVGDREVLRLWYPGSIVFEYFLLGKRKITQLIFYRRWKNNIVIRDIEDTQNSKQRVREVYE